MAEEIVKVETLPEPCLELLNKTYVASKKTNDKLPKGKYKCYGSGFRKYLEDIDTPEELRQYILDNGEFKDIPTGEFEEVEIDVPLEEIKPAEEVQEDKAEEEKEPEKKTEQRPIFETIKVLVISDKEFFIKEGDLTCYIKSDEDYKELVIPTKEEIKGLGIKTEHKQINYFWSPIVDDEGE